MIYFDTSYIVRLYLADPGWEKVRATAQTEQIVCSLHGRAETMGAFHRKLRESFLTQRIFSDLIKQFAMDSKANAFQWLPLSPRIMDVVAGHYAILPPTIRLRAADALHLACAADAGFREIYSNDTHLLGAAPSFGLRGVNII